MVKDILLKATSEELLKQDYQSILQACNSKEFLELVDGYMEIFQEKQDCKKITYKYNLAPLIAYNLAGNDTIADEIDELYGNYEQCSVIRKQARSMNTWMSKIVPIQQLESYYKILCLLELAGKNELPKCSRVNPEGAVKTGEFFLGMYRTCDFDTLDDEEYETFTKEILRLVKKANKKLYRKYRYETEVYATKILCDVYEQEKVLIKTTSQLAVLLLLSFVDDEMDIHILHPESIPISLNYILQDFAECYSVNKKKDLPIPTSEQKKLIDDVASGRFRCAYSQLYAEKKQHFAKFALPNGGDNGKYYENALVAYRSMYPDTDIVKEDINNYLIGAVHIQVLLDHLSEYQSAYEETLLNADIAKENVQKAERSLLELQNKEIELKANFWSLEKEREEMLSVIQRQEKQIESLQNKLQAVMEKKEELQQKLEAGSKSECTVPDEDNAKLTPVTKEDMVALERLRVCFIGGHPNFTKKVKQRFLDWKFIDEKQGNFPKNMLDTCDVIFQAETHCNHALSERLNDVIGKKAIPCIFIGNVTNLTLCVTKMVTECKKNKLL